jgi:Zn-dependent M28 family amino/carboxypeptidase
MNMMILLGSMLAAPVIAYGQDSTGDAAASIDTKPKTQDAAKEPGKVVDGPTNIRQFNPEDTTVAVDATNINLRKVFEDLGPDATLWYQHVQTLANPFFEGRAPGTRGGEIAAEYVEFFFRQYGLHPAFPGDGGTGDDANHANDKPGGGVNEAALTSYRQPFDFESPDPKAELIRAAAAIGNQPLEQDKDFVVLGVSGSGSVTAPVTFVGYAIAKGQDDYTSFEENADLTGRIALVLRYEPLNEEGRSQWAQARFSRFSSIAPKLAALAERHAAGIILVNPPGAVDGRNGLESITQSARFGERLNVPAVQMSPEAVERLLAKADAQKRSLMTFRKAADAGKVKTANLGDGVKVTLSADLKVDDRLKTQNVAAILPGKGSLADQWIVIGAHYDHVGYGYTGAMPDNVGKLHPGADDNASGTAGVLLAAKRLARDYETSPGTDNRRSILFMTFGAEEAGLFGSEWFVKHSSIPASKIYCMLNMDMIGRLRSNNLLVQGTGTASEFDAALKPLFEASGMTISKVPGGRGPSDHSSFYNAGIPVLFLFTGEHNEYHRPQDRAYTVNPAGAVKIVDLLESIALEFSTRTEALTFANNGGGGAGRPSPARVRLGLMPAYNASLETGVSVESVADGTSAAEAGIKAGDVLLSWNGEELTGGSKLSEFLSKAKPGDKVKITLQRGEGNMTVEVTLKGREPG